MKNTNTMDHSTVREVDHEVIRSPTVRKLMKRPRSPRNILSPIFPSHSSTSLETTISYGGPIKLEEKHQRQMKSFLQNFLADEKGNFKVDIDLHQHARETGIAVTDATLQEVVNTIPKLLSLRLSGCSAITDAGIWAIARTCSKLQHIYLEKCERVSELGLRLLAHNCRLISVDLSECPQITDTALQTLAAGCWMIETFAVRRCQQVTDAGIVKIAQCCKNLTYLDVSECDHVGEFGDKALIEIGRYCHNLKVLNLFGCRHVHDNGIKAIAKGCPLLSVLKLTGCRDVSTISIRALTQNCQNLEILSLSGCIQTTNEDLGEISRQCCKLSWLDISGSPNIDVTGIKQLASHCQLLEYLNVSRCQKVNDSALHALTIGCASLKSLCLAGCIRVSEQGVDVLTKGCPNLLTLDLSECESISRQYLQQVIKRLELVEWASQFYGFQPLSNAEELSRLRDQRMKETSSAIKIQAVMRGCLARGGLWQAKLRHVERNILPKIQGRIRGFLVRRRIARERLRNLQMQSVLIISQGYRDYKLRCYLLRQRRLAKIRCNEEEAALIFQKIYRGYCGRKLVRKIRNENRKKLQLDSRIHAMRELAAIRVQRTFRGHRDRYETSILRAARAAKHLQIEKELKAATFIQRVYRGHEGRRTKSRRIAELLRAKQETESATRMQAIFRGHRARESVQILRVEAIQSKMQNAALSIQRYWRGIKDKHLAAVVMGLIKLREREIEAAKRIQASFRMYTSRGFMKALKQTMLLQKLKQKNAVSIQRVFRGHQGRAEAEVHRELQVLSVQARPLFLKEEKLQSLVHEHILKVDTLKRKMKDDEEDEKLLAEELEKTMKIKTKYHDSERITGTSQRYLTQYLQLQLADQLRAKRVELAIEARNLEALTTLLNDSQKQLRAVKRELQPLTDGVISKTRRNRTARLHEQVRGQRRAATNIQRIFRGYRVRCAMQEGANCWVKQFDEISSREYYYNMFSGETRWVRPLAMDIFSDDFVKPIKSGGTWYEAYHEEVGASYYYNNLTGEYQWSEPTQNVNLNACQNWLDQQDPIVLIGRSTLTRTLNNWEERRDPTSGNVFFVHSHTKEIKVFVSPREVTSQKESKPNTIRSARSINSARPVMWQFRYGAEYDSMGNLVPSSLDRSIWSQHTDAESGQVYYFNQLTNEYRWERPEDFTSTFEDFLRTPNSSRQWFDSQNKSTITHHSTKTRPLGTKWVEYVDVESKNTYYYNEITGETRWSLSPRSARDSSDREDQMPLVLFEQIQSLKAHPVPYTSRELHIKWLKNAVDGKDWKNADAIVQQILLREDNERALQSFPFSDNLIALSLP